MPKQISSDKELKHNFLYKANINGYQQTVERTPSGTEYARLSTGQLVRLSPKRKDK